MANLSKFNGYLSLGSQDTMYACILLGQHFKCPENFHLL